MCVETMEGGCLGFWDVFCGCLSRCSSIPTTSLNTKGLILSVNSAERPKKQRTIGLSWFLFFIFFDLEFDGLFLGEEWKDWSVVWEFWVLGVFRNEGGLWYKKDF